MKYNLKRLLFLFVPIAIGTGTLLFFQSCKHKTTINSSDRFNSDSSKIVVDESFSPIVDEEFYIFRALDKQMRPQVLYAPENEAISLLLADSVRVAILSRNLTAQENRVLSGRNIKPVVDRFAIDAVALIVNEKSNDTTITVSEIKKMLNGDTKYGKVIVFDNPNSGLVRYLKEFSGNTTFKQKYIYALKSNKDAIRYVSEHPNAIGIVGFSWLNDPDKDYADAVQKVKIVGVRDDMSKNADQNYFTPSQATLALKQYPLTRNLYILNCTGTSYSLGMKFAVFLRSDRGQRIILKSGLLPDKIPNRKINVIKWEQKGK
ncbi:MAG TPA: substrate-binding domain-containing protein [Mucilaginibacter sp.]|jgi:phosphate transport system substrate-binding protein